MVFEVENKYRVASLERLEARLRELGAEIDEASHEVDTYFAHPSRDLRARDEAVRIRCVRGRSLVTYKGPRIDQSTKTRREIEVRLAPGSADDCAALLRALGFEPLAEVRKRRRHVRFSEDDAVGTLDEVEGLGSFAELEIVTDESNVPRAREAIERLAATLGLSGAERRSYLELLVERDVS